MKTLPNLPLKGKNKNFNFRLLFKTLMTINLNINQTLILLRADGNVLYISLEKYLLYV